MNGSVGGMALAVLLPVAVAVVVAGSRALTAPSHAEQHRRDRIPSARLERLERAAGCLVLAVVVAGFAWVLWYLWANRAWF